MTSRPTATSPERVCFQLQVDPARLDEYREHHAAVWPEMLHAIADSGRRNYSLYLRADGMLVGVYETDDDAASQRALELDPRTAAWEAEMAEFFVSLDGSRPDQGAPRLTEVFNLEHQLAALESLAPEAEPEPEPEPEAEPEPAAPAADAGPAASVTHQTIADHASSVAPIAESSHS